MCLLSFVLALGTITKILVSSSCTFSSGIYINWSPDKDPLWAFSFVSWTVPDFSACLQLTDTLVPSSSQRFCWSLSSIYVSLALRSLQVDWIVLKVQPHEFSIKGKDQLPLSAGNAFPDAILDIISLRYSKGTLQAHGQLGVHQDPQVLFCRAASQLSGLQHVPVPGVVSPEMQGFGLHEDTIGWFLQPAEVPLDRSMSFKWLRHSAQLCVLKKHTEKTLCFTTLNINDDVKQGWSQYSLLAYSVHYWPLTKTCS